jgi:hypothetical protein
MKKCENRVYFSSKGKFSPALLFPLAFLLLIVSCPVKRFLKHSFNAAATSALPHQASSSRHSVANFKSAFNICSVSKETVFTTEISQQATPQSPLYFANSIIGPGTIHYFLSGINSYSSSSASLNSSVPLFLQHLRLLI